MGCDGFDWQIDRGRGGEKLKDREKWSRGSDQRAEHGYKQPDEDEDEDQDKPTDGQISRSGRTGQTQPDPSRTLLDERGPAVTVPARTQGACLWERDNRIAGDAMVDRGSAGTGDRMTLERMRLSSRG